MASKNFEIVVLEQLDEINKTLEIHSEQFFLLRRDVTELKEGQIEIRGDIKVLQENQKDLQKSVSELKVNQVKMQTDIDGIVETLANPVSKWIDENRQ